MKKPICKNCGQWQHKFKGKNGRVFWECLNDCVSRGFAQEPKQEDIDNDK